MRIVKEKYEMEIKSINYLEKDFEVQIHERLDVVWEEYIYKQEIIQKTFRIQKHSWIDFVKLLRIRLSMKDLKKNTFS